MNLVSITLARALQLAIAASGLGSGDIAALLLWLMEHLKLVAYVHHVHQHDADQCDSLLHWTYPQTPRQQTMHSQLPLAAVQHLDTCLCFLIRSVGILCAAGCFEGIVR